VPWATQQVALAIRHGFTERKKQKVLQEVLDEFAPPVEAVDELRVEVANCVRLGPSPSREGLVRTIPEACFLLEHAIRKNHRRLIRIDGRLGKLRGLRIPRPRQAVSKDELQHLITRAIEQILAESIRVKPRRDQVTTVRGDRIKTAEDRETAARLAFLLHPVFSEAKKTYVRQRGKPSRRRLPEREARAEAERVFLEQARQRIDWGYWFLHGLDPRDPHGLHPLRVEPRILKPTPVHLRRQLPVAVPFLHAMLDADDKFSPLSSAFGFAAKACGLRSRTDAIDVVRESYKAQLKAMKKLLGE
jgi:hypothetical protein